jgi:hypothetical protein
MNKFLNSLCEVGDFYESLEVGNAGAGALQPASVMPTPIWLLDPARMSFLR